MDGGLYDCRSPVLTKTFLNMEVSKSILIEFAQERTKSSANVKDWRLTKKDTKLREIARNLPMGYILLSYQEMKKKYGDLFDVGWVEDASRKRLWYIDNKPRQFMKGKVKLSFCMAF